MITLKESIAVHRPVEPVFRYTADFTNIENWDPGVVSSKKKQGGLRVGSVYDLTLKFGPFRPKMQYVIIEYRPCSRVVLKGRGDRFTATDIITFVPTSTGTRIDYRADIQFSSGLNRMENFLAPVLVQAGEKAIRGLKKRLNGSEISDGNHSWFSSGSNLVDYMADHAIFPGMLMFSRLGYSISRRFWTDTLDTLYGKTLVITGGTSGIGKAAAFMLAAQKARVTIIARNKGKAQEICQEIIDQTGNPQIDFLLADLSLMADIRRVADRLIQKKKSIDILINNAGALFNDRMETPEGFEKTFATDLLGVFHLTQLLREGLSKSGARIINVSSGGMYTQRIDVNDFQNTRQPYDGTKAYARAKRGIVILTELWAGQLDNGVVHAMHPGWVDTPGIETALPGFHSLVNSILRTPEQGADTLVWLAASKEAGRSTGRFWLDRRPHETAVFPKTTESREERLALWEELNRLTRPF